MATTEWAEAFANICKKTHTDQAKWFLNGFWAEGMEANKEDIWNFTHMFIELETGKKILYGAKKFHLEEKADLDEMQAHQFLEKIGETLTVKELRNRLKKLDIDSNNRLCITEFLTDKYSKKPQEVVDAPQGGVDPDVLDEAQQKCDEAQSSLDLATEATETANKNANIAKTAADEAAKTHAAAEKAATDAKVALDESNQAASAAAEALEKSNQLAETAKEKTKAQEEEEAKMKKIQDEVKAAVEALEAEEKKFNDKISNFEKKIEDKGLSAVKKGSFVAQLAQLKSEDPMPLRKARITQASSLKKQKKAAKKAEKVTALCREAQKEAEKALEESNTKKKEADNAAVASAKAKEEADSSAEAANEAKKDAEGKQKIAEEAEEKARGAQEEAAKKFQLAHEYLQELNNKDEPPKGALWWMERIMQEKEKFMPKRRKKKN